MSAPLLEVSDLRVTFASDGAPVPAVRGLDLELEAGRTLALVGESGSGKSAAALAIARLLPADASLAARRLTVAGRDVLGLGPEELCALRGRELGLVFQDPGAALDPVMRVGPQVAEGPRLGRGLDPDEATARTLWMFERVGLAEARATWLRFPHQLSGGQRQRVGLAMALVGEPRLLVADEPTTALDVTLQAQVLDLLGEEVNGRGMGLLLIAHDLAVVARLADEVAVVYAGRVVERAPPGALFTGPRHPYTRALLRSRPERAPRGTRLEPIPGQVPHPSRWPSGCPFRTRCAQAVARCAEEDPIPRRPEGAEPGHVSACHLAEEVPAP